MAFAQVVASIMPMPTRASRPLRFASNLIRQRHQSNQLPHQRSCYSAFAFQSSPSCAHKSYHQSSRHQHDDPLLHNHQIRRRYHLSATKDEKNKNVEDDIDEETMARHNTLSRRLYRTLLRSCRDGVGIANRGNTFDEYNAAVTGDNSNNENTWILLQPPMDQRKYGFAKIAETCRGELVSTRNNNCNGNETVRNMNLEEVAMAMEVLRFVHISLGGSGEDDLEDYYLGSLDSDEGDDVKLDVNIDADDADCSESKGTEDDAQLEDHIVESFSGAAAGRHSEGHYTQFLDDDEERGEADDEKKIPPKGDQQKTLTEVLEDEEGTIQIEWDSDDDEDDDSDGDDLEMDESVLVTSADLQNAVRIAFRAPLVSASQSNEEEMQQPLSTIIARRHGDAINACSQLSEQFSMWGNRSSISIDHERGVRVVATSSLMMRTTEGAARKNRFCYRIRVENIMDTLDDASEKKKKEEQSIENDDKKEASVEDNGEQRSVERRSVQLLGRAWKISERGTRHKTPASMLQRLLEDGVIANKDGNNIAETDNETNELRVVQSVNEPKTGAVGHLPVLGPGEVFEYMSGADIATPTGAMEGCFHMATVDMQNTDSAHVGDQVEALMWKPEDERRFEMPIGRFGLVADDGVENS